LLGKVPRLTPSPPIAAASPLAALGRHERILIWCCILAVTAVAWAYLFHLHRQMSPGIEHDPMMLAEMATSMATPWTPADVFFTFAMWVVMMAGMMAGPAAPAMLLFAGMHAQSGGSRMPLIVLTFALGYALVWIGFSAVAALAQWMLHNAALLSPAMTASSSRVGGAILCAAGVYQFTPLKGACLRHCRSPLGFFMTSWRDGTTGALQMGMRHGAYCLGCCWALMCVLFVVGVMNLVWVAGLTLLVLVEKIGPAGAVVARVAGAAMVIVGILFLVGVR